MPETKILPEVGDHLQLFNNKGKLEYDLTIKKGASGYKGDTGWANTASYKTIEELCNISWAGVRIKKMDGTLYWWKEVFVPAMPKIHKRVIKD